METSNVGQRKLLSKSLLLLKHRKNCDGCAQHKLPGNSSLNVSFVCPICPANDHNHHDHHDNGDHDDHGDHEKVGVYMRKFKVAHKEVGGCLESSPLVNE